MTVSWGADTPISMPVVPKRDQPPLVDFGGFAFTAGGICHNITAGEIEDMYLPPYAPNVAGLNDG